MKKLFLSASLLITIACNAQLSQQYRDSIDKLNEADHQQMMEQLHITTLRPGGKRQ